MTHAVRELLTITLLAAQSIYQPTAGQPGKDVVWVPTPPEVVEKMLDLAKVTPDDFVIDLGSGDGRNIIAAAKRGARALGVEFNPDLVELSRRRAKEAGVAGRAAFVQGDMYKADISQASVLALFLTPEVLDQMRDKFLAMKPGTRIVVNTFPVTDWEPDVTETTPAPCKIWCTTMLMIVPAQVAGTWRAGDVQMTLRQDFQFVRGKMGEAEVTGRLRGDEITLRVGETEYVGRVAGDHIEGTVTTDGKQSRWQARRNRAQ
jgi:SAM-dependent methyltransferase